MGWPKLAPILIVICCVFPSFDFPSVAAETSFLLTKLDHKQFLDDGEHEQFVGKLFQVEDYKGQDQCDARPDNQEIRSFGILFQIDTNGLNGGHGMTFCFPGQLDPLNKILGLTPASLYQVPNVEGNEVAKICIKAQCKGKENCPEYENAPWHGFNLRQTQKSRDMEVRLSTTNSIFTIPSKAIQSGQFFLKLTKHNSIITNFSTEIGPGYNPYIGRPRSPSVENKGQISVKLDQMLRDAYFVNVRKGAFLKYYMGLWALAADILPHIENNILNFFVIRSECSDLDASFIFPWDAHFTPTKKKFPAIPSKILNQEIYLKKSKVTYIRGRVNANAAQFSIQLIKLQIDGNELLKGIRLMVGEFDENGKGMGRIQACNVVEVEHCFGEGKKWVNVSDEFIEFHRVFGI